MMVNRLIAALLAGAMLALPLGRPGPSWAGGPKYARTEVEKAVGKCVGSVLGGALLGAFAGRLAGGRNGAGTGAAAGAIGGAAICGILIANAKHRDRIIQAQLAAASDPTRPHTESWADDNGQPVTYVTRAGAARTIDGAQLVPVQYQVAGGGKKVSPALDTGGRECREVAGAFAGGAAASSPQQLVCRTPEGDWQPYAENHA